MERAKIQAINQTVLFHHMLVFIVMQYAVEDNEIQNTRTMSMSSCHVHFA